jgi:flagellar L-ring protein precursor FlgH
MKATFLIVFGVLFLAEISFARPVYSLYTDKKGKRVGDVITVLVLENAQASNNTKTRTGHKNDMEAGFGDPSGIFSKIPGWNSMMNFKAGTEQDFEGKGETQREGTLQATVSVKIVEVLDNGNLLIQGTKQVTLNEEIETIELTGLIRPEDISGQNTVLSNKIADAKIKYSGNGVNSDAQKPGWITRIFNWMF